MSFMYLCIESNYKKKYKTIKKLIEHLLIVHGKIIEENNIPPAQEIFKDNRKQVENKRNDNVKVLSNLKRREEILRQEELQQIVEMQAREEYLSEYKIITRLKLEAEKLVLQFEIKCK